MDLEIDKLQKNIHRLLRTSNKPNDALIFNIEDKKYYTETYRHLLEFTLSSLIDFLKSNKGFKSYHLPGISQYEKEKFDNKKEEYRPYTDLNTIRDKLKQLKPKRNTKKKPTSIMKTHSYLTYQELHTYNREYHIREYMKDKDYEEKNQEEIFGIFTNRIEEMEKCLQKNRELVNITKTKDDLLFLEIESARERIILSSITQKSDLSDELKKMANYIIWGTKQIKCYYNDDGTLKNKAQLDEYVDEMLDKLRVAKEGDPNCVKKMMTFLPLYIFKVIKSNGKSSYTLSSLEDGDQFDYDEDKLREYYIGNGTLKDYNTGVASEDGIIKGPNTQFRLGIGYDLFKDQIGKLYFDINGLWSVYNTELDLFNSCGKYVNYSIYVNLLQMYMFMIKNESLFPASFSLRKEIRPNGINRNIYNEKTQSYEFRNKDPISKDNLFNENMKLIGVHFIKYINYTQKGQKLMVLPLFVFINKIFNERKAIPRTTTKVTTIGNDFISSYTGDEREVITCDQRMYFIEDGEITPAMSLTYHELTNILFYGAKTYMIGDDRKELYFTMAKKDDPGLQTLIELLNMTEVFFVKGPIEGFKRERFKIMTREEVLRNNRGELMGHQQLGGKKTKKKINRSKKQK